MACKRKFLYSFTTSGISTVTIFIHTIQPLNYVKIPIIDPSNLYTT